jgi:hypothetical protein
MITQEVDHSKVTRTARRTALRWGEILLELERDLPDMEHLHIIIKG